MYMIMIHIHTKIKEIQHLFEHKIVLGQFLMEKIASVIFLDKWQNNILQFPFEKYIYIYIFRGTVLTVRGSMVTAAVNCCFTYFLLSLSNFGFWINEEVFTGHTTPKGTILKSCGHIFGYIWSPPPSFVDTK